VLNMARQIGAVFGVAMLVSILGTPTSPAGAVDAFRHGWLAIVLVCALAAVAALAIRRESPAPATAPRRTPAAAL
jgi:hypothetical protein